MNKHFGLLGCIPAAMTPFGCCSVRADIMDYVNECD